MIDWDWPLTAVIGSLFLIIIGLFVGIIFYDDSSFISAVLLNESEDTLLTLPPLFCPCSLDTLNNCLSIHRNIDRLGQCADNKYCDGI